MQQVPALECGEEVLRDLLGGGDGLARVDPWDRTVNARLLQRRSENKKNTRSLVSVSNKMCSLVFFILSRYDFVCCFFGTK